jgi:DAK2 domain fusion protein YloV
MTEIKEGRESRVIILQQYPINGLAIKRLTQAALSWLEANKQTVNALNVFPVPDGDTGTNMVLTMKSALEEIGNSGEREAGKMFEKVATGALMGARGNSGVILSQLWRGFAQATEGKEFMDGETTAKAFAFACDAAYKGVVRPVEGTILTVAKDIATATEKAASDGGDAITVLRVALDEAAESVERTPDLLPILKEAGVVDSGGKGLFYIIEGMVRWIEGKQIQTPESVMQPLDSINLEHTMEAVEEGQDYEIVVDFRPHATLDLENFYKDLEEMGTSIQVGEGNGMFRMHIHVPTENRYIPIDYTMGLGVVTNVAIENLMDQMQEIGQQASELNLAEVQPGHIAVVAVAPGPGIARLFAELGVASIIEGGQTMNPSTKNILSSFENLSTDKIVILPNNKNITMAAEAVVALAYKEVVVVPAVNVPQGLAAMLRFTPDGEIEDVVSQMKEAIKEVECGEITTATRNVEIDGVEVKEGQIIGFYNGKLIVSSSDLKTACLDLLNGIKADEYELITLFYGQNIEMQEVENISEKIQEAYPDHEIEIQPGGQPHYHFIMSIE